MRIKLCNIEFNEANCELIENYLREHSETNGQTSERCFRLTKLKRALKRSMNC